MPAFDKYARDAKARQSIDAIFAALQSPTAESSQQGRRLPVCSALDQAPAIDPPDATLSRLTGHETHRNREQHGGIASQ